MQADITLSNKSLRQYINQWFWINVIYKIYIHTTTQTFSLTLLFLSDTPTDQIYIYLMLLLKVLLRVFHTAFNLRLVPF